MSSRPDIDMADMYTKLTRNAIHLDMPWKITTNIHCNKNYSIIILPQHKAGISITTLTIILENEISTQPLIFNLNNNYSST